jgi:very-short-patch-repair endonuclease
MNASGFPSPRAKRGGEGSGVGGAEVQQEPRKPDRRVARARTLRRDMTDAEKKLWWHLRRLPLESGHFRRQATIGRYFADFVSHQHKLIIEVDGSGHGETTKIASDAERTAYLESRGYRVLRFWNNEVFNEIEGVMTAIYAELNSSADSAPPTPNPSPPRASRAGGGE